MENNNVNTPVEQELPVQQNEKKSLFDKLDSSKKKKFTFGDKIDSLFSKLGRGFYKVRCVCCFTTLFSTIGIILAFVGDNKQVPMTIGGLFILIGLISSLLSCPGRLIAVFIACIVGGFEIGLCFLGIGCIIGLCIGIVIGGSLALYFPAIITIKYYFSELRYKQPD